MHTNGLTVVGRPFNEPIRSGRHFDCWVDVLGSLPQENRVREVSLSF
jgi:hypothetical protein